MDNVTAAQSTVTFNNQMTTYVYYVYVVVYDIFISLSNNIIKITYHLKLYFTFMSSVLKAVYVFKLNNYKGIVCYSFIS